MFRTIPVATGIVRVTALVVVVATASLAFAAAGAQSGGKDNGLSASVAATVRGPLTACHVAPCTADNVVWEFVYVANQNDLTSAIDGQFLARDTLHNAFLVTGVEQRIFVDGEQISDETFTPPPNEDPRASAGRWPSTLRCPAAGPCTVIGSPAIVPGEQAAVLFAGWNHAAGEPNGKYVFEYTVHGTLNGAPTDVTATARPIVMTD